MAETVRDVMTPGPLTIGADVSIEDAARLMRRWDVREVFVTDQGRFCGVLTYRDIVVLAIASDHSPATTSSGRACDPATPRLDADEPTAAALDQMRRHSHRHLPVVHDEQLIGTIWIDDLLTQRQRCHRHAKPTHGPARPPFGP